LGVNSHLTEDEINLFLESVELFSELPADARRDLAKELRLRSFNQGDLIFTYGDVGNELWIVQDGTIELAVRDTTGDKIVLTHVGPAEVFGELSLLDGGPRSASATALEPSRA
jgi:CRP-like cAMP-binding protein